MRQHCPRPLLISTSLGLVILSLLSMAPASGAPMTAKRAAAYARLPDWSGVWLLKNSNGLIAPMAPNASGDKIKRDYPPLKPDWELRYASDLQRGADQGIRSSNPIVDTYTTYCLAGMPRNLANGFDRQFILSPDHVWIITGGEVRQIHTDGRSWPAEDEMFEKFWGWSIGRWQGETLLIETRHLKAGLWLDTTPLVLSDKAVILERLQQSDADTLDLTVTINDTSALSGPWTFRRQYARQHEKLWVNEKEVCGGPSDRNPIIDGHVTTQLPP